MSYHLNEIGVSLILNQNGIELGIHDIGVMPLHTNDGFDDIFSLFIQKAQLCHPSLQMFFLIGSQLFQLHSSLIKTLLSKSGRIDGVSSISKTLGLGGLSHSHFKSLFHILSHGFISPFLRNRYSENMLSIKGMSGKKESMDLIDPYFLFFLPIEGSSIFVVGDEEWNIDGELLEIHIVDSCESLMVTHIFKLIRNGSLVNIP